MPLNQAQAFQLMAHKDLRTIQQMAGESFDIEIFGFHAQQAVEKSMKAWIRELGGIPPITHNIAILIARIEELGQDMSAWQNFVELNTFAVQLRYQEVDDSGPNIDRQDVICQVELLLSTVDQIVGYSE